MPRSLIAVSSHLRRELIGSGFPSATVTTIHNGIEAGTEPTPALRQQARQMLGLPVDSVVFGTIARLDPVKDLGSVIHALSLKWKGATESRLVIVGDGPDRGHLESVALKVGVANRVIFTGHRHDARDLLPAFDVFVNSSIAEGLSLTILEAMAASLPVIATAVGGTPELVIDGETGLLVTPRNPLALADAMDMLRDAADYRCRLGARGRRRVCDAFTFDRMIAAYHAIYARSPHASLSRLAASSPA